MKTCLRKRDKKNDLSQLAEEKNEMEFDKKNIEIELQKTIEEARLLEEVCDARKSHEEAFSQAENKTSVLDVQDSKAASEMEVEKMREEIAIQTSKLAEAYNTITTLENALSLAEKTKIYTFLVLLFHIFLLLQRLRSILRLYQCQKKRKELIRYLDSTVPTRDTDQIWKKTMDTVVADN
ncbi:hypothetical protein V6Z11_A11G185800 [Gossypium hirsutum]